MACEEGRFIKLEAVTKPGHLRIMLENAMTKGAEVVMGEGGLITTKEEAGHGIGTQNAFAIVRKYVGEYEVKQRDNIFSVGMVFPLT